MKASQKSPVAQSLSVYGDLSTRNTTGNSNPAPRSLDELAGDFQQRLTQLDQLIAARQQQFANLPENVRQELEARSTEIQKLAADIEQIKTDLVNEARSLPHDEQHDIAAILIRNKESVDQAEIMFKRSKQVSESVTFEGIKTRNIITLAGIENKTANANSAKDITSRTAVYRPLNIIDLINWLPVEGEKAYYLRESSFNILADIIPEAQDKPESELKLGMLELSVGTIAHFIRVSKQALKNMNMLAMYIESRMAYGVRLKLEYYVVNGHTPASGQQKIFSGLLEDGNFVTVTTATDDTAIDVLNKAKYKAAATFIQPDCTILNPEDWGKIERIKGGDGHYIFGSPGAVVQPVLWGVPVVFSATMPVTKYWTGPLNYAFEGYLDENVDIIVSTEDSNNVTKNLVTVLAEVDGSGAVVIPDACVSGTLPEVVAEPPAGG
ncbi:TPA: phage major capsid protein [Acinetobacter baumannii]|uniref:phage major capsid protein n=1 Tax=Acinetobacter baumannii TaxID=470 RepID=UPI00029808A9|nr:phage major capsid protein [Acinetobacter baumannii]EHZ6854226.1 phage major capsid protein [Acinetobacter baumannii]EIU9429042.1 phage major capsid protein [Acinetobacter baumannii]EKP43617.1 phage major capsid protein, HK97 family [Acinetobacter baumannii OIFC087]EKU8175442.1 phage major capsid protein [Acinetobacter baumannii]EKV2635664.1 phage major capsid protein [Acinetobacter baumannii]